MLDRIDRALDLFERLVTLLERRDAPKTRRATSDPIKAAESLAQPNELARVRAARALRKLGT